MKYLIARLNADGSTSWLGFGKRWHSERPDAIEFHTRLDATRYIKGHVASYVQDRTQVVREG